VLLEELLGLRDRAASGEAAVDSAPERPAIRGIEAGEAIEAPPAARQRQRQPSAKQPSGSAQSVESA
jgi:hypothetical protein